MTDKNTWLEQSYTPFEQGCRERFFLAATNFLFSNFAESLACGSAAFVIGKCARIEVLAVTG